MIVAEVKWLLAWLTTVAGGATFALVVCLQTTLILTFVAVPMPVYGSVTNIVSDGSVLYLLHRRRTHSRHHDQEDTWWSSFLAPPLFGVLCAVVASSIALARHGGDGDPTELAWFFASLITFYFAIGALVSVRARTRIDVVKQYLIVVIASYGLEAVAGGLLAATPAEWGAGPKWVTIVVNSAIFLCCMFAARTKPWAS